MHRRGASRRGHERRGRVRALRDWWCARTGVESRQEDGTRARFGSAQLDDVVVRCKRGSKLRDELLEFEVGRYPFNGGAQPTQSMSAMPYPWGSFSTYSAVAYTSFSEADSRRTPGQLGRARVANSQVGFRHAQGRGTASSRGPRVGWRGVPCAANRRTGRRSRRQSRGAR